MSRSAILRAAGAYADEVARSLGLLTLKASVLAGLRIQDGNKYAPDERLIPKDPEGLHAALRDAWLEYASLGDGLSCYLEDSMQIEINLERMSQTDSWNDALALAAVSAELRHWDPLAQVTLAANLLRCGQLEGAERRLAKTASDTVSTLELARIQMNRAGVADCAGDAERASFFAGQVLAIDPTSCWAYSLFQLNDQVTSNQAVAV